MKGHWTFTCTTCTIEAEDVLLSVVDLNGKHGWKVVEANETNCEVFIMNKLCGQ